MATVRSRDLNRTTILMKFSILSATALGFAALCVSPSHAGQAQDYAWCSPQNEGGSLQCMYSTYQQCIAAVSGLGGGGCAQNPELSFSRRPKAKARY
jgi:Protein of unknown function (DUF3551)